MTTTAKAIAELTKRIERAELARLPRMHIAALKQKRRILEAQLRKSPLATNKLDSLFAN